MPLASAARGTVPQSDDDGVGFTLSSSLPPMVAGAVMGEMELSVPFLHPKPGVLCPTRYLRDRQREPLFAVRMLWWGDDGPGTVLKPGVLSGRDKRGERARQEALLSKATCALFPVRCGLDGLTAYLKDMVRTLLLRWIQLKFKHPQLEVYNCPLTQEHPINLTRPSCEQLYYRAMLMCSMHHAHTICATSTPSCFYSERRAVTREQGESHCHCQGLH